MAAVPIWKDKYVTLGSGDSILFRILLTDTSEVIYQGRAHKRPGDASITARVNDICADWLVNVLPGLSQAEFTRITLPVSFTVQASSNGSSWTTKATVQFLNDWSYDYGYNAATMGMSFPITGRIDSRMPIVWTGLNVSQVTATIRFTDGSTATVIIAVEISDDFNNDYNNDFAQSVRSAGSGTAVFLLDDWDNVAGIDIGRSSWDVVTDCARYALYYVNAYGGWDSLLIEGGSLESDALTRHTRAVDYDNGQIVNRGIQDYVNEVDKGFTLHTGWLLGDQGEMMHHLINSTDVYLYDIAAGQMIPVVLTDTTCEYKNYRNNGNRLVDYTIRARVAQNRVRR